MSELVTLPTSKHLPKPDPADTHKILAVGDRTPAQPRQAESWNKVRIQLPQKQTLSETQASPPGERPPVRSSIWSVSDAGREGSGSAGHLRADVAPRDTPLTDPSPAAAGRVSLSISWNSVSVWWGGTRHSCRNVKSKLSLRSYFVLC